MEKSASASLSTSFKSMQLDQLLFNGFSSYGIEVPSIFQQKCIPQMILGGNIFGHSQPGSGKTICFIIGVLAKIDYLCSTTQAVIITATTGSVAYIRATITEISRNLKITCRTLDDFSAIPPNIQKNSQILIGTPRGIANAMKIQNLSETLKIVILTKIEKDLSNLALHEILFQLPQTVQKCLFTSSIKLEVLDFGISYIRELLEITVKSLDFSLDNIKQCCIRVHSTEEKLKFLIDLLGYIDFQQGIIYVDLIKDVKFLCSLLRNHGFTVGSIDESMSFLEVVLTLKQYRKEEIRMLITTDLSSKCTEFYNQSLVVNYDFPQNNQTYLARVGQRRRVSQGICVNLISESELDLITKFERHFNTNIKDFTDDISLLSVI